MRGDDFTFSSFSNDHYLSLFLIISLSPFRSHNRILDCMCEFPPSQQKEAEEKRSRGRRQRSQMMQSSGLGQMEEEEEYY